MSAKQDCPPAKHLRECTYFFETSPAEDDFAGCQDVVSYSLFQTIRICDASLSGVVDPWEVIKIDVASGDDDADLLTGQSVAVFADGCDGDG